METVLLELTRKVAWTVAPGHQVRLTGVNFPHGKW